MIGNLGFTLVFLDFPLWGLKIGMFRHRIRIPGKKICIYGQMLTKNRENPVKLIKNNVFFTNLNVGLLLG